MQHKITIIRALIDGDEAENIRFDINIAFNGSFHDDHKNTFLLWYRSLTVIDLSSSFSLPPQTNERRIRKKERKILLLVSIYINLFSCRVRLVVVHYSHIILRIEGGYKKSI